MGKNKDPRPAHRMCKGVAGLAFRRRLQHHQGIGIDHAKEQMAVAASVGIPDRTSKRFDIG